MTSHELARKLLAGPDKPVQIGVAVTTTTLWADPGSVTIDVQHEVNLVGQASEVADIDLTYVDDDDGIEPAEEGQWWLIENSGAHRRIVGYYPTLASAVEARANILPKSLRFMIVTATSKLNWQAGIDEQALKQAIAAGQITVVKSAAQS